MESVTLGQGSRDVLDFISGFIAVNDSAPTLREIARGMGFRSTNGTRYHLNRLVAAGEIRIVPIIARGIRIGRANHATSDTQTPPSQA